jgi:hypothetical protein
MNTHDVRSIPAATVFEPKANASARAIHELDFVARNKIGQLTK